MTLKIPDLAGHEGYAAPVLPDGSTATTSTAFTRTFVGYQAACSCGWTDRRRHPPTPEGTKEAEYRWWSAHAAALLAAAPPSWLVVKSNLLHEQLVGLAADRPLAALTLLAQMETWQRALLDRAVSAARASGASWTEIGDAMGITKQAAHERFRTHATSS
ncbi:hypothetical protein [Nonomuraea sp. NPDC050783]|uniref:hypothetical protein n=1 Tax=Nonomuraea sp. NPDC050783 TaxID=3154634 RepID=UPI003465C143